MSNGFDIKRVLSNFDKKMGGRSVFATLHDIQEVTPDISKVIVSFSSKTDDKTQNYHAIAGLFKGYARPIENSFCELVSSRALASVGFITRNDEVREITTAALQKYKVMAGNILMDEEDSTLWELKSFNGSKYLTRKAEENLSELIALASVPCEPGVARMSHIATASVENGELLTFVCPETSSTKFGFVIEAHHEGYDVVCESGLHTVKPDFVVQSLLIRNTETSANNTMPPPASKQGDKNAMKDYYAQMFKYNPDYAQMMQQIVDSTTMA